MSENETAKIIGLLESVYEAILTRELQNRGLQDGIKRIVNGL